MMMMTIMFDNEFISGY